MKRVHNANVCHICRKQRRLWGTVGMGSSRIRRAVKVQSALHAWHGIAVPAFSPISWLRFDALVGCWNPGFVAIVTWHVAITKILPLSLMHRVCHAPFWTSGMSGI